MPTDAPFLPMDYVARMMAAIEDEDAELACASTNGRTHPLRGFGRCADARIAKRINRRRYPQDRSMDRPVPISRCGILKRAVDPFFNANRPEDLKAAEVILAHQR